MKKRIVHRHPDGTFETVEYRRTFFGTMVIVCFWASVLGGIAGFVLVEFVWRL